MKIFIHIIFFLICLSFNTKFVLAEEKSDCSKISTKTYVGLLNKMKCKKGIPYKEYKRGKKWGDINPFKPRDKKTGEVIAKQKKECHEYTTKTVAGLLGKLKCRRDAK
mgnify:CR=1 FL=1